MSNGGDSGQPGAAKPAGPSIAGLGSPGGGASMQPPAAGGPGGKPGGLPTGADGSPKAVSGGSVGATPPTSTQAGQLANAGNAGLAGGLGGLMGGMGGGPYVPGFSKFDPAKDAQYKAQQTAQQPYQPPATGDPNTNMVNNAPATTPVSNNGQSNFQNQLGLQRMNKMYMQEQAYPQAAGMAGGAMQPPAAGGPGGKPGGLPQGGGGGGGGGLAMPVMAGGGLVSFAEGGMMRPRAHHPHEHAMGLAALGRHGDSTLVHMSPGEVHGLQKLAMATGGSLTRNPHTGLLEAGWLSSVLPMVAGGVLAATGVGAPAAAAMVAAEEGIRQKDWKKGLMAGLGAYGGAGLGGALTGAGEAAGEGAASAAGQGAAKAAAENAVDASAANLAEAPGLAANMANTAQLGADAGSSAMGYATPSMQALAATPTASPLMAGAAQEAAYSPAAAAGQGMFNAASTQAPTGFAANMSNMGKGIAGLTQKGGMQAVADQGVGRGTLAMAAAPALYSAAYPDPVKPPPTSATEYYIPAPGQKSLYNPGVINPAIAKYGYLPTGQSALIGQGWNPGVYSTTLPGYGGAPSQFTGNGILATLMRRMQAQQPPNLSGYVEGGLIRGPGDGTSDSIPGLAGGHQPIKVANEEFIIPARIVAELGNGSSSAGAQRLHEMMRRVEAARKKTSMAGDSDPTSMLPA